MPRYLFHVFNDQHSMDSEGKELFDLEAARANAIQGARGIMADELQTRGQINLSDWIEIEDEDGEMTVVPFADAVTIKTSRP